MIITTSNNDNNDNKSNTTNTNNDNNNNDDNEVPPAAELPHEPPRPGPRMLLV